MPSVNYELDYGRVQLEVVFDRDVPALSLGQVTEAYDLMRRHGHTHHQYRCFAPLSREGIHGDTPLHWPTMEEQLRTHTYEVRIVRDDHRPARRHRPRANEVDGNSFTLEGAEERLDDLWGVSTHRASATTGPDRPPITLNTIRDLQRQIMERPEPTTGNRILGDLEQQQRRVNCYFSRVLDDMAYQTMTRGTFHMPQIQPDVIAVGAVRDADLQYEQTPRPWLNTSQLFRDVRPDNWIATADPGEIRGRTADYAVIDAVDQPGIQLELGFSFLSVGQRQHNKDARRRAQIEDRCARIDARNPLPFG